MSEPTTFPPPPPESLPSPQLDQPHDDQRRSRFGHPVALFAVAFCIATAVAIVIGAGVGLAAFSASASSCTPSDGWCELGAALVGVAVGGAAGLIAYIVTGVMVIRRNRPAGQRGAHVAAHLAAPPAVIVTLQLLTIIAETIA